MTVPVSWETVATPGGPVSRAEFRFSWRDGLDRPREGRAAYYLAGEPDPGRRLPLFYAAGYELPEESAVATALSGWVVATTLADGDAGLPEHNPLCRGPNMDFTLIHMARALPFVDRRRVVVGGGSAGGYMALLLAAEGFPLAAARADAPVVNLCYEGAFALENARRFDGDAAALASRPFATIVPVLARGAMEQYGESLTSEAVLAHSPVAHVGLITCPVSAVFSTADLLVPVDQAGAGLVRPVSDDDRIELRMEELVPDERLRLRLLDALDPGLVDLRHVQTPPGTAVLDWADPEQVARVAMFPVEAPEPPKQWAVTILNEGPPDRSMLHFRYAYLADHGPFTTACVDAGIGVGQLTEAKLAQLLRRHAGVEWLAPGFRHLDDPAAERADVEAGLRAYCETSPAHQARFAELYRAAPAELRVLDEGLVRDLSER